MKKRKLLKNVDAFIQQTTEMHSYGMNDIQLSLSEVAQSQLGPLCMQEEMS